MSFITLMTDFGIKDGNVGVMKGVIWNISPHTQIADLSHMIAPQNILEAALVLGRSAPYFASGAIHVVVVDPGVGTRRRPIAARLDYQFFVGPDNGVCTLLLEHAEKENATIEFVHLNRPRYWLHEVSHVFHGRDIFAPVAAHLANGVPLVEVGTHIHDPVRLSLPRPQATPTGWKGEVVHIDHFGNISTNILREHLGTPESVSINLCGADIEGMVNTFGERQPGDLVALYGSTGSLIISVVNGSAARHLNGRIGDDVVITIPG